MSNRRSRKAERLPCDDHSTERGRKSAAPCSGTLSAGFHVLVPFLDAVRYKHSLKEQAIDIPEHICITRTNINIAVVTEPDKATEPSGIKVLRYEIKNITPPHDVLAAKEKQMRAEREKRATMLNSEGVRDSAINTAEGEKQQTIKASEANRQQRINEAEGQAQAILSVAEATAEGIRKVALAIQAPGGFEAVQLRVAEQYVTQFGQLAKAGNSFVVPANLADVASMITLATNVIKRPDTTAAADARIPVAGD